MKLIEIDKQRYRKHLNYVIVSCIGFLLVASLGLSQLLISLFPDPSGSHFHWNLTGVIIASLCIGLTLHRVRHHPFMREVVYVWELKQALNKITRKMPKLQAAAKLGNAQALNAIHYSYAGSRLLWHLDDNTIVMEDLAVAQAELDSLAKKYHHSLDAEAYDPSHLQNIVSQSK